MSHTILWQRLDVPGHEFCSVDEVADGWSLSGTAVFGHQGKACVLSYRVHCSRDWRTESAHISGRVGVRDVDLDVAVDQGRRWFLNGEECPAVEGCLDIDLGFSPSTNLLAIRRLSLGIGESADVRAAWLPFPDLAFEPLPQVYQRQDSARYHYESGGGAFVRALEVDGVGFVMNYPGLWQSEP